MKQPAAFQTRLTRVIPRPLANLHFSKALSNRVARHQNHCVVDNMPIFLKLLLLHYVDAPRIADVIDTGTREQTFVPDVPLPVMVETRTRIRGLAPTRGFENGGEGWC